MRRGGREVGAIVPSHAGSKGQPIDCIGIPEVRGRRQCRTSPRSVLCMPRCHDVKKTMHDDMNT
jgi:hypothetical protein